jgi:predicted nucleotidyltransferase
MDYPRSAIAAKQGNERGKMQLSEIDISPLQVLLERIKTAYRPLQVWLFGSRARGDHKPESDWDLFVVVPDDAPEALFEPGLTYEIQKDLPIYADIIPWPVSNFLEDWSVVNSLPHEISRDGVLLYEH